MGKILGEMGGRLDVLERAHGAEPCIEVLQLLDALCPIRNPGRKRASLHLGELGGSQLEQTKPVAVSLMMLQVLIAVETDGLDGGRPRVLTARPNLQFYAPTGKGLVLLSCGREFHGEMVAAVAIALGFLDVVPFLANDVRGALADAFDEPVYPIDVVQDRPASAEILHLVEPDRRIGELTPDGRHPLWPCGHVSADGGLPHGNPH